MNKSLLKALTAIYLNLKSHLNQIDINRKRWVIHKFLLVVKPSLVELRLLLSSYLQKEKKIKKLKNSFSFQIFFSDFQNSGKTATGINMKNKIVITK